jgi:hypothetical protein
MSSKKVQKIEKNLNFEIIGKINRIYNLKHKKLTIAELDNIM